MSQVEPLSLPGVPAHTEGGTPLPLPAEQSADALDTIEFGAVLERVAGHAVGPLGARRVRDRWPSDDVEWIQEELARVGQVASLFRRGDTLLAEPIPDVTRAVGRLRIEGSVLEGVELAGLQRVLVASRLVNADLRRVADVAPLASALARPLPDKAIERRLELSLDPEGNLLDTASPRLAAARREVHAARQRLLRRLDSLLRGLDSSSAPSDASVTMRGGRYVIPVRRDSRSRPAGIIHDESGSAGTLFIEPSDAIELGNALREAQVEEERETLRVLRELTDLLRPELPLVRNAVEMCVAVDDLVARARYAVASNGEAPDVTAAPSALRIVNGRHPLLLAGSEPVIPFDLDLDEQERTLLISGPNTGGKTVLLKAVGLAAALAGSGIIPPVGPGSCLPVFSRFYADIGDRQSIAASLSTFSAHVRMLRRVLEEADDVTLVLLDEIGSGTDPAEGAALAGAALVSLTRRGSVSLATTHLGSLKDLASHTPGIVNASLQFDAVTLTPTYRFLKGVPGRSYGLAIARRLGVAAEILADAEARVPDAERSLDALLAAVEERERELQVAQGMLAERAVDLDSLSARLALQNESQTAREAELKRREKEAERQGRQQARAYLLEARQRVEEALGAARGAADESAAREARRLVEEGIRVEGEALAEGGAAGQRGSGAESLDVGSRVRLESGGTGEVTEIRSDGRVVVAAGSIRMVTEASGLTVISKREETKARTDTAPLPSGPPAQRAPAPLEIDLRGMTGDEAEVATLAAVDAAVLSEQPYLRIIHGMGTGVVRERVQRVVSKDRRVARYAFAPRNQGGTGVTIVEFSRVSMIPDETIEQVRDSTDIVGLIGESVALKRTGSDYRGPCPFHGGTNRNFAVIPKKGRYYCFVCHESGDVFSWFMKRHGMDYPTAVREAARRTGIVIPERAERAGPDPHEPLYSAVAVAHDWFARQLLEQPEAKIAREYLEGRDIPMDTAAVLGLAFAPMGKTFLKAMADLGINEGILLQAGLAAQRDDGSVIPRFRGRLLFPIHNLRGRVVGLGGRLLVPGEPKYLNSPETDIFHKGKQLYNLHQAKGAIRKEESVLLVEGYFDVIRLSLVGVEHVVAPLGTALTPEQATLLKRFAPAATILYDSDLAGLRATFRAGDELLRHAIRVRVATLPPGEDPDTLVKKGGAAALEGVLGDAIDLLERKIQMLERKGYFEGVEHRREALDRLLPTIRAAADPITRELYLSLTAERAGVSKDVLEQELKQSGAAGRVPAHGWMGSGAVAESDRLSSSGSGALRPRGRRSPETQLLAAMLAAPELIARAREDVAPALLEKPRLREIFEVLLQSDGATGQLPETLSENAAAAWSYLKEAADELSSQEVATLFDKAAQILRARSQYREMDALTEPGEKQRMRAELRRQFPAADDWYKYQKAARRETRNAKRPPGA